MPMLDAGTARHERPANSTVSQPASGDLRVVRALEQYVSLLQVGAPPGRSEFLERHASIAESLRACLDGLGLVQDAARELDPEPRGRGVLPDACSSTLG